MTHRTAGGRRAARRTLLKTLPALVLAAAGSTGPLRRLGAEEPDPERGPYRFGVFPYLPALKIDAIFGPVAASLSRDLGTPIHLRTKPTFEQFAEELAKESYDIIFVHPFFYVDAHDRYGYLPVARLDEPLRAVLMVPEDSPVRELSDLRGQTVALPPPLAGVNEMTRMALLHAGLNPDRDVTVRHYRTKMSCLQAVAMGSAVACGVPNFLLDQLNGLDGMKLRPLFETPAISHMVYAVHGRVPEADRRMLRNCIVGWSGTSEGEKIMSIGAWTRFVDARDEDYDEARRYRKRLRLHAVTLRHARG